MEAMAVGGKQSVFNHFFKYLWKLQLSTPAVDGKPSVFKFF